MHAVMQQHLSEISSWLDIHGRRIPVAAEQSQEHDELMTHLPPVSCNPLWPQWI